ncbi:hypothetical protein BHE74_00018357, partial [Ensete ventricosum]
VRPRTWQYVLVRQLTITRTARYRAVPPKSIVDGRLRGKEEEGETCFALPRFPLTIRHLWAKNCSRDPSLADDSSSAGHSFSPCVSSPCMGRRNETTKAEEPKVAEDPLAAVSKAGAVLMVCWTCGKKGDHWTAKCPYKDLAPPTESLIDNPPGAENAASQSGTGKRTYVPPSMRAGAARSGTEMKCRNDENSVRITNLSEDTQEPDLLELIDAFGPVTRIYVAMDQKKTGVSRGFGFINFVNREDAERAINKLNCYGVC